MATSLKIYLSNTYLASFIAIGLGLTFLCNLIELLEKLVYAPHVAFGDTLLFVTLNMVPTWLTILPITAWLAMIATIYHLDSRNEWSICWTLGITPQKIIVPLLKLLVVICVVIAIAKHAGLDWLCWQKDQQYQRIYKHTNPTTLHHVWHTTPSGIVCIAGSFTQENHNGRDLTIYAYNKTTGSLVNALHAKNFTTIGEIVYICQGTSYSPATGTEEKRGITVSLPSFIATLQAQQPTRSLTDLLLAWWHTPVGQQQQRSALLLAATADAQPLVESALLALITLLIFMFASSYLLVLVASYPVLLGGKLACIALISAHPLTGSGLYCLTAIGLLALAKRKNSRILNPTVQQL